MTAKKKIVLLFGGQSPEHEVSIQSGARVARGLEAPGEFQVAPVYIDRAGRWHWTKTASEASAEEAVRSALGGLDGGPFEAEGLDFASALGRLAVERPATVFIILHGVNGEDGRLQGALELAGLRYTGSGSAASALAMDKPRSQACLISRGLPVPRFAALERRALEDRSAPAVIESAFGLPCVIKPALGGSSLGVAVVRAEEELRPALEAAFAQGPVVHAEQFIRGREFTCGILERDRAVALPVTEIVPPEGRLFDYEAKYTAGVTREITPAGIDEPLTREIQRLALETHRAIGCEGFSRVDFICDAAGPKILEINTIPGMTATSLLPQAAACAGIDFEGLVRAIVEHSLGREPAAACVGRSEIELI